MPSPLQCLLQSAPSACLKLWRYVARPATAALLISFPVGSLPLPGCERMHTPEFSSPVQEMPSTQTAPSAAPDGVAGHPAAPTHEAKPKPKQSCNSAQRVPPHRAMPQPETAANQQANPTTVQVEDEVAEERIVLLENPVTDTLKVQLVGFYKWKLSVLTPSGRPLHTASGKAGHFYYPMTGQPAGDYFVRVYGERESFAETVSFTFQPSAG